MWGKKILYVEDDVGTREMIELYLISRGFTVKSVADGEAALKYLQSSIPDLVLLDIELPGKDGFEICKRIRQSLSIPIIFLSVRSGVYDKVHSFEIGGDDYLTKPFKFMELEARIHANLRRHYERNNPNIITCGPLVINTDQYHSFVDGEKITLSRKEMEILIFLAKHRDRVWSQEQLYENIWGIDGTSNLNTIKVHISNLRQKLELNPAKPQFIKTVRGFGYKFCGDPLSF